MTALVANWISRALLAPSWSTCQGGWERVHGDMHEYSPFLPLPLPTYMMLYISFSVWSIHQYKKVCHLHVAELTIPNVVNEIADIYNWEELGIYLGMEKADIEKIGAYHQKEQHQRLVETWFCRDPDRSWEKIHRAMEAAQSAATRSRSIHSNFHSSPISPLGMVSLLIRHINWQCYIVINVGSWWP